MPQSAGERVVLVLLLYSLLSLIVASNESIHEGFEVKVTNKTGKSVPYLYVTTQKPIFS